MSQNSAIAIDKLRSHTQRLWRNLLTEDKRKFLNHDAALWNVTRHRIAVSIHNKVTDALDSGRLKVVAGTIESLVPGEQRIDVVLRDADGSELIQSGDLVINCTGPQSNFSQTGLPLFDNLLAKGMVSSDELDLGLQIDDDFAVMDHEGNSSSHPMQSDRCLKAVCGKPRPFPNCEPRRCGLPKACCNVSRRRLRKQTSLSTTSESSRAEC
jgi:uncharacterized NAD(P)/FAD-binding protein YdhS